MPVDYTERARIAYLGWLADGEAAEQEWIRTLRDYASGVHPVYLTERQKQYIGLRQKGDRSLYAHNLCALIISVVVERLGVTGFTPQDDDAAQSLLAQQAGRWWEANRMDARQDDLYEAAARDGVAYVQVDWQDGPAWYVKQAYDGTQGVQLHQDPETGRVVFASNHWQTYEPLQPQQSARSRVTLYFPDRIEKYISRGESESKLPLFVDTNGNALEDPTDQGLLSRGWAKMRDSVSESWPLPWVNGMGQPLGVPVIPFENPGGSEIDDIVALQDLLNKSDLDLVAGQDTSGFPVVWAAGVNPEEMDESGNPAALTLDPGKVIKLFDPSAHLARLETADLTRMIESCKYWIECIAALSRTPQYLFHAIGADQPSGESLRQQEIGLLNKCARKQKVFGNAWEDVVYMTRRLWNHYESEALPEDERLSAQWQAVTTPDPLGDAQAAGAKQLAGIPKETTWAEMGYTAAEIAHMKQQLTTQQAREMTSLGEAMATAERRARQNEEGA